MEALLRLLEKALSLFLSFILGIREERLKASEDTINKTEEANAIKTRVANDPAERKRLLDKYARNK